MVDFGSRDGGNPLGSVDFERLISALRFLQNKEDHEVSPFVLTWRMGTSGFERTQEISTRSFERAFDEAVGKSSFGKNRLLEEIKKLINNSSDPSESFLHAENNVLGLVKEILGGLKNTDYLTPLASLAQQQDDGLDILTLNYDLAVEKMAQERGVKVNYGFSQWTAGIQLNWSQEIGTINIIKMHGSLNWRDNSGGSFLTTVTTNESDNPYNNKPWIVLGDKEKLSTKGPTLSLLRAAEDSLKKTTHLVIAGYSFSDDHVNNLIHEWIANDALRTISIIDPSFPAIERSPSPQSRFIHNLCYTYSNRISIIRKTTQQGLPEGINQFPEAPSENWFKIKSQVHDQSNTTVVVELTGRTIRINDIFYPYGNVTIEGSDNPIDFLWTHGSVATFIITRVHDKHLEISDATKKIEILFNALTDPDKIKVTQKLVIDRPPS